MERIAENCNIGPDSKFLPTKLYRTNFGGNGALNNALIVNGVKKPLFPNLQSEQDKRRLEAAD
jgi:hypothetical protein